MKVRRWLMAVSALVATAASAQAREERYICYGTHTTGLEHGGAEGSEFVPGEVESESGSTIEVVWSAPTEAYFIADAEGPYAKCAFTGETIHCGEGAILRFFMNTLTLVFTQIDALGLARLSSDFALRVETGECRVALAGEPL